MIKQITQSIFKINIANRSLFLFATKAKQGEKPQLKIGEKSANMRAEQIQKQLPDLYKQLQTQAAELEKQRVKQHKWRMKQLKKRISPESVERVTKINDIINGLTQNERQYLKLSLVKKAQNIQ